jgi:hypothetical protein
MQRLLGQRAGRDDDPNPRCARCLIKMLPDSDEPLTYLSAMRPQVSPQEGSGIAVTDGPGAPNATNATPLRAHARGAQPLAVGALPTGRRTEQRMRARRLERGAADSAVTRLPPTACTRRSGTDGTLTGRLAARDVAPLHIPPVLAVDDRAPATFARRGRAPLPAPSAPPVFPCSELRRAVGTLDHRCATLARRAVAVDRGGTGQIALAVRAVHALRIACHSTTRYALRKACRRRTHPGGTVAVF